MRKPLSERTALVAQTNTVVPGCPQPRGLPGKVFAAAYDKMLDWMSTVGIDNVVHTATASLEDFIEVHSRVPENMVRLRENLPGVVKEIRLTAQRIVELV